MDLIKQCFRFNEMLSAFVRRELRQRYIGSVLGWPWPFIQPLIMLAVYYVVFVNLLGLNLRDTGLGQLVQEKTGGTAADADNFYIVLICCGLLAWLATAEFLMRSVNTIPENGNLVKKVAFPSELLPVSLLISYVINMLVMFAIFCAVSWIATGFISPLVWLFPVVLILHAAFLLGLAYLLATANVFVRDVNQLAPIVINLFFFLTPIVYVREVLATNPDFSWLWIFDWNPMAYCVDLYRLVLVYPAELRYTIVDGQPQEFGMTEILTKLAIFGTVSVVALLVGYKTFMAKKHKFADEI